MIMVVFSPLVDVKVKVLSYTDVEVPVFVTGAEVMLTFRPPDGRLRPLVPTHCDHVWSATEVVVSPDTELLDAVDVDETKDQSDQVELAERVDEAEVVEIEAEELTLLVADETDVELEPLDTTEDEVLASTVVELPDEVAVVLPKVPLELPLLTVVAPVDEALVEQVKQTAPVVVELPVEDATELPEVTVVLTLDEQVKQPASVVVELPVVLPTVPLELPIVEQVKQISDVETLV